MDDVTTTTIVKDALDTVVDEMRDWAERHGGEFPVTQATYFKCCAALRLLEEEN